MAASLSARIAGLRNLTRGELLDVWRELYGRPAPPGIRREIIVPFLAYRMQEQAYGGLKSSTRSELRRIARTLERTSSSGPMKIRLRIKPGTRLVREWRGASHQVTVTESGYEYRGLSYSSLSKIARNITGTRWSGPAFFGLNETNSVRGQRDD
jgi:hypothetical protein